MSATLHRNWPHAAASCSNKRKKIIVEGIETVEQLTTLKELGVPVGQGYLLSRPLRPDQVPALFDQAMAEPA